MAVYSLTEEGDRFQINFEFLEKKITLRSLDRGEQYRFLQKVLKLLRAYCTLSYHRAIDISSRSSAERIFSEELNLKTPVLNQDDVSTVFRRDGGRQRGRGKHYSGRGFSCQGAGYTRLALDVSSGLQFDWRVDIDEEMGERWNRCQVSFELLRVGGGRSLGERDDGSWIKVPSTKCFYC